MRFYILECIGVRELVINLIKSCLSNSTQIVKVNGVFSEACEVNLEVSQESILGPVLFILYIIISWNFMKTYWDMQIT